MLGTHTFVWFFVGIWLGLVQVPVKYELIPLLNNSQWKCVVEFVKGLSVDLMHLNGLLHLSQKLCTWIKT